MKYTYNKNKKEIAPNLILSQNELTYRLQPLSMDPLRTGYWTLVTTGQETQLRAHLSIIISQSPHSLTIKDEKSVFAACLLQIRNSTKRVESIIIYKKQLAEK